MPEEDYSKVMDHFEIEFVKYELAKLSFQECLEYLNLYEIGIQFFKDKKFTFERAISKSFVITYARPFTDNKAVDSKGVGSISTKWLKELPEEIRKTHNNLVGKGRNSLVAHIDINALKPNVWIKEQHNDYVFDWCIPMINYNTSGNLRELVRRAYSFSVEHQEKIKPKLKRKHIVPTVVKKV